jgi:carbon storage regulator CsrA
MLILSRKFGEEIVMPELGICIRLVQTRGAKARHGIRAPAHVLVHRREVRERIKQDWNPERVHWSIEQPVA